MSKKPIAINGETLSALQKIELEMLEITIGIFEKLGLKYYLVGGTLLGAVRHGGFIPWDDDIDIAMPRADYEIFIKEAQQYYPEGYFVQHLGSEPNLSISFCKIRNSNTAFMERTIRRLKINKGIFIDIFPLDYYPDDESERKLVDKKNAYFHTCTGKAYSPLSFKHFIAKLLARIKTPFTSYKRAVRQRDAFHKSIPPSSMLANYNGAWGIRETVPVEWYGEGEVLSFGGVDCRVPIEYDKWLRQVYGDYMKLPPPEKRVSHHYVDCIDTGKSYKEYERKNEKSNYIRNI